MRERSMANYNFLITITSDDQDLVNNFGYRVEERFAEKIKRSLMKAMAERPYIVGVSVNQVSIGPDGDIAGIEQESMIDEDDEE